MMKWIYLLILTFLFSGCEMFESQEQKDKKEVIQKEIFEKKVENSKEVQLEKISSTTEVELAVLNSKKELATIEKEKEIEKLHLQAELEKQKIILTQEKDKAIFEQKLLASEQDNSMELKRYLLLILAVLLIICASFIFYYFKKRREDKLQAYKDNLQKYFYQKENENRMKIAEKILDNIANSKLDKAQKNQLIGVLSEQGKKNYQERLDSVDSEVIDTPIVEK